MKKTFTYMLAACLGAALLLSGCGGDKQTSTASVAAAETTDAGAETGAVEAGADKTLAAETGVDETLVAEAEADKTLAGELGEAETDGEHQAPYLTCQAGIRIGSLKGPTSMGLVSLMDKARKGETENVYEFTMTGKADELVGKIANADLDIALLPANVASVLYAKTQGNITVLDINTLGVLYVVTADDSITSMADLKGRTIYMTGKGTTPEYVMNYLLRENGMTSSDVDLQFKSEAAEVASILKEDTSAIGVLPQPFATAACIQNEALKTVLDLTEEWNLLNKDSGSMLVTGVTIIRSDFLRENRAAVEQFIKDHQESTAFSAENIDAAAELIAAQGIVEKAPVAKKALPQCNIVCLTGEDMKEALSGYLSVLYDQDAKSIGGAMPGDNFYYMP